MIKTFAPVIGNFEGRGMMADGTELVCRFESQEVIGNVCYGMRLNVVKSDSQNSLVDAYIVMTTDADGKLELQYIDGREHVHAARWIVAPHAKATSDSRLFTFEAVRPNGSSYRLHFDIVSAAHFYVYMEASGNPNEKPHEVWRLHLEREHTRPYPLRAA